MLPASSSPEKAKGRIREGCLMDNCHAATIPRMIKPYEPTIKDHKFPHKVIRMCQMRALLVRFDMISEASPAVSPHKGDSIRELNTQHAVLQDRASIPRRTTARPITFTQQKPP